MKVVVNGKCLAVRTGTNKNTGKDYSVADIYDGSDLIKVFGVDVGSMQVDKMVSISCNLNVDYEKRNVFLTAIR